MQRRAVGLALLVVCILAGIVVVGRVWRGRIDTWTVGLWFAVGVVLPIAGRLIGKLATRNTPPFPKPVSPSHRKQRALPSELTAVLLILLVGTLLRVYRIDSIPPGIFVDETNAAGDALRILDGWHASPFGVGWFETPLGYVYYLAGLIKIFGPTYYTLKVASLIPAILTLVAFYPLARELFGPRVALIALAFLAFNRWHMTMSRWGWNEVAPPLFHILTVYFLLRGSRTHNLGDFILAGVLMGLGMYTYLASRLVVLAILAYVGYRAVIERGYLRRVWPGLVMFLLAYTLVFAPLATTYVRDPFTFLNRSRQVSILNDMRAQYTLENAPSPIVRGVLEKVGLPTDITFQPLKESIVKHLRMFHFEGDYNARHNIPGEPMLDTVTGVLFAVGLAIALWRWRDHRYGLILIWIGVTLLGGVLTLVREAPQAYRTLGVVPAICLLAGDTLARLSAGLTKVFNRTLPTQRSLTRHFGPLFISVALLVAGLANVDAFFHRWATARATYLAFSPMETTVAREVAARLSTHSIYLSPTLYWGSPVRYLTYRPASEGFGLNHPPFFPIQPVEDLPLTNSVGENALFILEPLYMDLLELFTEYYPGTFAELVTSPYGDPLYLRVTVPREDIVRLQGLDALYELADGRVIHRREKGIQHRWPRDFPAESAQSRVERVTWFGSIFVPHTGRYSLRSEGGLLVKVDSEPWTGPRMLGKGLHALEIAQESPGSEGHTATTLFWQREGEEEQPVPLEYLFAVSPPQKGLLGTYYRGENWQGPVLFTRVDRALLMAWIDPEPVVGPFSVTWTGILLAPVTGDYHFRLDSDDGGRLWLDGRVIGESLKPDTVNQVQADVHLSAGPHTIRVDYFQRGGAKTLTLRWRPPGGREVVIPPSYLRPAPSPSP